MDRHLGVPPAATASPVAASMAQTLDHDLNRFGESEKEGERKR
jgi:hypothetical protein